MLLYLMLAYRSDRLVRRCTCPMVYALYTGTDRRGFLSWVHIWSDDRGGVLHPWQTKQWKLLQHVPVPRPLLPHHGNHWHHPCDVTLQRNTTTREKSELTLSPSLLSRSNYPVPLIILVCVPYTPIGPIILSLSWCGCFSITILQSSCNGFSNCT